MSWRDKLEKLEKDVAGERENETRRDGRKKDATTKKIQRAFDDLKVMELLESIRDEMWGAGTIVHELNAFGFQAELFFDYPDYIPGFINVPLGDIGPELWNPPKVDFTRESLTIKLYIEPMTDRAMLGLRFSHPDYDLIHNHMSEVVQRYGLENITRFLGHDGYVSVGQFILGEDLSECRESLNTLLLQYCAIKSFLPREAILEEKCSEVLKALDGFLPVELVNQAVIDRLEEMGFLNELDFEGEGTEEA